MKESVLYPGTFDPVTNGHVDLVMRAVRLFPQVIIAVATSNGKQPFFSLAERISMLQKVFTGMPQVRIHGFSGLLVDFAREQQATVILRGLRGIRDFEFECQLAGINRQLSADLETIFLTPQAHLMPISSTLVREIAMMQGDITAFVPPAVQQAFAARLIEMKK